MKIASFLDFVTQYFGRFEPGLALHGKGNTFINCSGGADMESVSSFTLAFFFTIQSFTQKSIALKCKLLHNSE